MKCILKKNLIKESVTIWTKLVFQNPVVYPVLQGMDFLKGFALERVTFWERDLVSGCRKMKDLFCET